MHASGRRERRWLLKMYRFRAGTTTVTLHHIHGAWFICFGLADAEKPLPNLYRVGLCPFPPAASGSKEPSVKIESPRVLPRPSGCDIRKHVLLVLNYFPSSKNRNQLAHALSGNIENVLHSRRELQMLRDVVFHFFFFGGLLLGDHQVTERCSSIFPT